MATYSFKSVGKTQEQNAVEALKKTQLPFGIKTPLALGSDAIFDMNFQIEEQLADNLKNLLLTNWGERLGLYRFGANLKPLTTEFVSQDDFDTQAIERIRSAVESWMPFIDLEDFTSTIDRNENRNTAIIKIVISYRVPVLQTVSRKLQIVLYVI
jgi:phage baseplate assembly protein W